MRARKTLVGLLGVFDGTNRVYSDSNPPETLMMTDFPSGSVATPGAGLSVLHTPDGKNLYIKDNDGTVMPVDSSLENILFHVQGAATVGVGSMYVPIHGGTFTIMSIAVRARVAPTGASLILDVNKNGTTIFGTQANRPTIAAAGNLATVGAFSVSSVTTGDYLSVDVDQIGSTVAGSDIVCSVRLMRTA